jgi:hypothetical protein
MIVKIYPVDISNFWWPMKNFFCLMFFGYAILSAGATARSTQLGDRLLLEVGNTFYSQYQLQCYDLVRTILDEKKWATPYEGPNAGNWGELVRNFALEMVILQEAQRLGSFFPTQEAVGLGIKKINSLKLSNAHLGEAFAEMQMDEPSLLRTVAIVLQVGAFRANKPATNPGDAQLAEPKWLKDLLDKTLIRYLDGSRSYMVIEPTLEGRKKS